MAGHFSEYGLLPEICKTIEEFGWYLPTDIQSEAIPLILGGGDVLMAAETGTGKTGAFCIPLVQIVYESVIGKIRSTSQDDSDAKKFMSLNNFDRDPDLEIEKSGHICHCRLHEWRGCRADRGVVCGSAAYFEVTIQGEGISRVGWSTVAASFDLGTDKFGFGYGGTGKISNNRAFTSYGENFGNGDVIGCFFDFSGHSDSTVISFSKNGKSLGTAFKIHPDFGNQMFFPAGVFKNCSANFNFGDDESKPLKYGVPQGYMPVGKIAKFIKFQGDFSKSHKVSRGSPLAIVIEPTRELAIQTYNQIERLIACLPDRKLVCLCLIGGIDSATLIKSIQNEVHIIVCTPAKLKDFMDLNHIHCSRVQYLVLDEADALLEMDNKFISTLWSMCPKSIVSESGEKSRLQLIICSATLHSITVQKFVGAHSPFANWVDLKGHDSVPDTVHHVVCRVDAKSDNSWKDYFSSTHKNIKTDQVHLNDRFSLDLRTPESLSEATKMLKFLYFVRAIKEHNMEQVMVFCRTRVDCDNLHQNIQLHCSNDLSISQSDRFSAKCLHSGLPQQIRDQNLEDFKNSKFRILICTAVAARGIDIVGVPYVILMTVPDDRSLYLHIIGRVGRADRMGLALTFASSHPEKVWFHKCRNSATCKNTYLTSNGGCCVWYNDLQYLSEIEEHLHETITTVEKDLKLSKIQTVDATTGDVKIVYGEKKLKKTSVTFTHFEEIVPAMKTLREMEKKSQIMFFQHSGLMYQ